MNTSNELLNRELTIEESKILESLLQNNCINVTSVEICEFRNNFNASLNKGDSFESSVQQAIDGLMASRAVLRAIYS